MGTKNKVGLSLLWTEDKIGLIILDESLNGIDKDTRDNVIDKLIILAETKECPVIVVTHTENLREYYSNTVVLEIESGDLRES